jgi:hypothetical protein
MRVKRWRRRLLFLSVLFGAVFFLEQRYGCMRLRNIEIIPASTVADSVIWRAVPKEAETFWPSLLLWSRRFTRMVENFYPVRLTVKLTGWGRYRVTVEPLEVFLSVSWNRNMWLLSSNGRMWLSKLQANSKVKGVTIPERPVLAWDAGLPLPIDPDKQRGDIYPSSLPMTRIRKWYDAIEEMGWNDKIYCLRAKKIDGKPVVQILLGSDAGITGELTVKDDPKDWVSFAAALEGIYPSYGGGIPSGLVVNATFADMKFTVISMDVR